MNKKPYIPSTTRHYFLGSLYKEFNLITLRACHYYFCAAWLEVNLFSTKLVFHEKNSMVYKKRAGQNLFHGTTYVMVLPVLIWRSYKTLTFVWNRMMWLVMCSSHFSLKIEKGIFFPFLLQYFRISQNLSFKLLFCPLFRVKFPNQPDYSGKPTKNTLYYLLPPLGLA